MAEEYQPMTNRDEQEWEAIARHFNIEITQEMRAQFAQQMQERKAQQARDEVLTASIAPEILTALKEERARLQRLADDHGFHGEVNLSAEYEQGKPRYMLSVTVPTDYEKEVQPTLDFLAPQVQQWDKNLAAIQKLLHSKR